MLLPHVADDDGSLGSVPALVLVLYLDPPSTRDSGAGMDTELISNSRDQRFCKDVCGCHCRENSGSGTIKKTAPRRHNGIPCFERKRIGLALV
tara:strand:+ start:1924 stop:2202 length:279 start_codon:yes stop_codon:yes gene_type:complete